MTPVKHRHRHVDLGRGALERLRRKARVRQRHPSRSLVVPRHDHKP